MQNNMKKYIFTILAIGLTAFSLVNCSDDEKRIIKTSVEMNSDEDFMELSQIGKEYKIDIITENDAAWKASIDGILGDIAWEDTIGVGPKTITLYTSTNIADEDSYANLCITFPGHEESNIIIPLKQAGRNSNPDNATQIKESNKAYAVGFGYDTRGRWANIASVKAEILNTKALINKEIISTGPVELKADIDIVTGSSITELTNQLNTSASVSGSGWGFKGEAGASFNSNDFKSNNYEYAIIYMNIAKKSVTVSARSADALRSQYMTSRAYAYINGLNDKNIPDENCEFPSTEEGFERLIQTYGTHMVNKAKLGGQINFALKMDVSKIKGNYDLRAFASMSYKGFGIETNASVSDELKKSYEENKTNITSTVSMLGGDNSSWESIITSIQQGKFNNDLFKQWRSSLIKNTNLALVDFDASDALIPLYEMVDKVKYPERYEAMKQYMKTGRIESINSIKMDYQCGTSTKIEKLPDFSEPEGEFPTNIKNPTSTLIKDVYNKGQWVGRICNEYIPVINKKERVTVIYPVLSNRVKYNMGYFVGDAGHAPARVCWQGDNLTVTECHEDAIGEKTTLYLRGSDVSAESLDDFVIGEVKDATIKALGPGKTPTTYDYPIVKIFNKIWMRENYQAECYTNGNIIYDCMSDDNTTYYTFGSVTDKNNPFTPDGWRITSQEDFLSIKKTLDNNNVTHISVAKAFQPDSKGGILGFHSQPFGYYYLSNAIVNYAQTACYGCLKKDGSVDGYVAIYSTWETFQLENVGNGTELSWNHNNNHKDFPVRLVQDITE